MTKPPHESSDAPPCEPICAGRLIAAVVLACLAVVAVLVLCRTLANAFYPYRIDTGEGAVLTDAWRVAQGRPIYAIIEKPPYVFTIYNPIFIYLAGLANYLFGARPAGPRLVGALFYAGAALVIYLFVRRETGVRTAGVVAGLFMFVERHFAARAGFAVVDYTAVFFSLLGLYLWRGGGRSRYAAAAAFALAFFTKQTSIMAAGAAFLSLFIEGRRWESVKVFGVFLLIAAAGLAVAGALFGRAYFVDTFVYPSVARLDVRRSVFALGTTAAFYFVPAVWLFVFAFRALREKRFLLPVVYVIFGLLLAFSGGREGASRSYFLDLGAGLSIIAGLMWAAFEGRVRSRGLPMGAAALIAVQFALVAFAALYRMPITGDRNAVDLAHDGALRDAFEKYPGIVVCRELGFDVATASTNVSTDLYRLVQLINYGMFDWETLLTPIRRRECSLIIMPERETFWTLYTAEMREAVQANYVLAYEACGELFFIPAGQEEADD